MTAVTTPELSLDPLQREATTAPEGPAVIIGGPGTGKTRTLIGRIAALIKGGAQPETICYLTFSSRGADDVRQQLASLPSTQEVARDLFVGTLHHYASTFIRQAGANILEISPHFTIWDQDQAAEVVTNLLKTQIENMEEGEAREEMDMAQSQIREFLHWHSLNRARRANEAIPADKSLWYELAELYTQEKRRQNTLDLDDLIPTAIRAMEKNEQTRVVWGRMRSRHIMVDEFQDITPVQYRLLQLMTGPTGSVTVATDPNQSIYAFRGADAELMEQFRLDHHEARMHVLRLNHRSTRTLTDMATALTDHESMRGLHHAYQQGLRPEGRPPTLLKFKGENGEMDSYVLDMAQGMFDEGHPWENMAIIYRRHATANRLTTQLIARQIPYTLLGDTQRQKDSDARRITSLMTCLLNPMDTTAFQVAAGTDPRNKARKLTGEIGRQINETAKENGINLIEAAEGHIPNFREGSTIHRNLSYIVAAWQDLNGMIDRPQTTLRDICLRAQAILNETRSRSGMQNPAPEPQTARLLSLSETTNRIPGETTRQYLSRFVELMSIAPYPDHRNMENDDPFAHHRGITMASIHASKGLQWKTVWVMDASDHILPGPVRESEESRLHEEQRTFYVAATRATDNVFFCNAEGGNKGFDAEPSRFLEAMGDMLEQRSF